MSKNFTIDYIAYILFRSIGVFLLMLPKGCSLFLARRIGDLLYCLDRKHRSLAYSNLKTAFSQKVPPAELMSLTRKFYQAFMQNLIEIFFIPLVNKQYLDKYLIIEGREHISEAFKKGKGVIFLGVHAGSWELSNVICAKLGFTFSLFVRKQKHSRLNELLNLYRQQKGCKIIQTKNQTRHLIEALRRNESIGMTLDQGGRLGTLTKFFGKNASMSTGAIRIAMQYGSTILPVYFIRRGGPYIKLFIDQPVYIEQTGERDRDIHLSLNRITCRFEEFISKYPREYLWTYKIWKYSDEKNILVLHDGKTGHLRQSQAAAALLDNLIKAKGLTAHIRTLQVRFKNNLAKRAFLLGSSFAGRYSCQGCLCCLRACLDKETYAALIKVKPDIIISCGSALAPVNYLLSKDSLARSIVIMRPAILSARRFDLAILPRHDNPRKRKNTVVTEGSLNLINEGYLKEQAEKIAGELGVMPAGQAGSQEPGVNIGLMIGGDTKDFHLEIDTVAGVIRQLKDVCESLDAGIMVTTSRRTASGIERLVKSEFNDYPRCRLLVIANEKNLPEAVGGILGLSQVVVISPESISMISEAASSNKYVVVFNGNGLGKRHVRFLENFSRHKFIHLCEYDKLGSTIDEIWRKRPAKYSVKDNSLVAEAMAKRIL